MERRSAATTLILSMFLLSCNRNPVRMEYSIMMDPATPPGLMEALSPAINGIVENAAVPLGLGQNPEAGAPIQIRVDIEHGPRVDNAPGNSRTEAFWDASLVPVAQFSSGTTDTGIEECLGGTIPLALPDVIPEGFVALFVDGLSLDAPGYPLEVRVVLGVYGKTRAARTMASSLSGALRLSIAGMPRTPAVRWLAAGGDMMLGRGAAELLAKDGAESLMGGAAAILSNADAAVVNLEGVITSSGSRASKAYTFKFDPSVAPLLAKAGIDAVLVSNNHAVDWGMAGFTDMLKVLERSGIGALGGGVDLDAAATAHEVRGFRLYGISSYPKEISGWDGRKFAAAIGKAGIMRAEDSGAAKLAEGFRDGVVDAVFVHGGAEWSATPDAATRELFHALVDAGADAVFGSHPHVAQALELYKGTPLFWSLGNFVFQGMQGTPGGQNGLLALVGFLGERALYIRSIPLRLDGARVGLAPVR